MDSYVNSTIWYEIQGHKEYCNLNTSTYYKYIYSIINGMYSSLH